MVRQSRLEEDPVNALDQDVSRERLWPDPSGMGETGIGVTTTTPLSPGQPQARGAGPSWLQR